jgi:hypothetical protein
VSIPELSACVSMVTHLTETTLLRNESMDRNSRQTLVLLALPRTGV